jgi:hypothetical protein
MVLRHFSFYATQAFTLIDQNHDGFITKEDLVEMYNSLGLCDNGTTYVLHHGVQARHWTMPRWMTCLMTRQDKSTSPCS